jgi:hypothetical protein
VILRVTQRPVDAAGVQRITPARPADLNLEDTETGSGLKPRDAEVRFECILAGEP